MAVLLTAVQWLRTLPLKVWLALLAALLLAGWLHEHDRRVAERAVAASAMRASVQQQNRLREAVVESTIARDAALKSARDTADAYQIRAAFLSQKIVAIRAVPLPVPTVTPSGDSVTFSTAAWEQHVALDAQRDSVLDDESAILRDGIPAIRNQYEAALAKDVKLLALKDSLINTADAQVRLLQQMVSPTPPRFRGFAEGNYDPQNHVGEARAGEGVRIPGDGYLTLQARQPIFAKNDHGQLLVGFHKDF